MLFISPPFGNYISTKNTTSIRGSFTLEPRDGLILQILKTLRYSFENKGWINKIGLRNPGIDYAIKNYDKNSIVSIAIMNKDEIPKFIEKIPEDMNIEINISCPNINKQMVNKDIDLFLNKKRKWCIIKLSPLTDFNLIDNYYEQGFKQFHCCNTLPIEKGGLSGPAIIPHSTNLIKKIREKYPDSEIIGGGGIKSLNEINIYKKAGANHFSISSALFNPFNYKIFLN